MRLANLLDLIPIEDVYGMLAKKVYAYGSQFSLLDTSEILFLKNGTKMSLNTSIGCLSACRSSKQVLERRGNKTEH